MSLTAQDLGAIRQLVDGSIDEKVPGIFDRQVQPMLHGLEDRLLTRIDDLDDVLSIQMENGLQEVRDELDGVKLELDGVKTGLDGVKIELDGVKLELDGVKTGLSGVQAETKSLRSELEYVKDTVERIERVQQVEVERNDRQDTAIKKLRQTLHKV